MTLIRPPLNPPPGEDDHMDAAGLLGNDLSSRNQLPPSIETPLPRRQACALGRFRNPQQKRSIRLPGILLRCTEGLSDHDQLVVSEAERWKQKAAAARTAAPMCFTKCLTTKRTISVLSTCRPIVPQVCRTDRSGVLARKRTRAAYLPAGRHQGPHRL